MSVQESMIVNEFVLQDGSAHQFPVGATTAIVKTSAGATTLLPACGYARTVVISVQVTEAFAAGTGAATTVEIGYTGSLAAFAATTVVTGALNATFSFAGTLPANTALIVTATAATGTGTGGVNVTTIAA